MINMMICQEKREYKGEEVEKKGEIEEISTLPRNKYHSGKEGGGNIIFFTIFPPLDPY